MMLVDRWFPFFDVATTLEEMDRAFGRVGRPLGLRSVPRCTSPAINVYEQSDAIVLTAEVPGVRPDDLDLTIEDDSVTIKGKRRDETLPGDHRADRREPATGSFVRTVTLPESVDSNSAQAEYKHGVLRVRMAKAEKAKARKIKITTAE
jgi:HSP20 family protein